MQNKPLRYFLISAALLAFLAIYHVSALEGKQASQALTAPSEIALTDQRIEHILYGDASGGGHKFGVGVPCKSEFPRDWDETRIIETTERIAANDNLPWRQEENGYFVTEAMEDDIQVRVVLGPERRNVITSYPVNVVRNPCY